MLTKNVTYWDNALCRKHSDKETVLHFYLKSSGLLYAAFNGCDEYCFLHGFDACQPLWLMMTISGVAQAAEQATVEFIGKGVVVK